MILKYANEQNGHRRVVVLCTEEDLIKQEYSLFGYEFFSSTTSYTQVVHAYVKPEKIK